MSEKNNLEFALHNFQKMSGDLQDLTDLSELAEAENDEKVISDILLQLQDLQKEVKRGELEALLSGEVDANDAYLEVHSGSGGTEAQDWAEMLLRMYTRWAEAHHYKVEYVEETEGDVAGIKSVTIKISGRNAYGWLKHESGVHRLVRMMKLRLILTRRIAVSIPIGQAEPVVSILTRPIRPSALHIFRPVLSFNAKISVRSSKTEMPHGKC